MAIDEVGLGVALIGTGDLVQGAWCEGVITVEPADNLACSSLKTLVDGLGLAVVGFRNPPGQAILIAFNNLHRVIRRAPIDDDVFKVGVGLGNDTSDGSIKVLALIETWSDYGDRRKMHDVR